MKAPRLTRSKSRYESAASTSGESRDTSAGAVSPFKTSFDDLRNPDGRQKLREQLSSAFPESYNASLKSSPSAASMAGMNWPNASSSSVDSNGNGPKRLSTLPEQNCAIDVEQAIHLLTELKKTATPGQLVALHKALLPTRDSVISVADSSAGQGQRTSLIRQKSMLPPGLATRGGASDDLLKRQEDVKPLVKKKSAHPESHLRVQSNTSIAALDLADDAANPLPALRAVTPNDEHYFGAFRPGTLRITNGAASPEPSLRPKPSGELVGIAISGEHLAIGNACAESLANAESETQAKSDPIDNSPRKRAQTFHGRDAQPGLPQSKPRDPSRSRRREPSQSRSRGRSPATSRDPSLSRNLPSRSSLERLQSITPLARSREPSLSRVPTQAETRQSKQLNIAAKKASVDTLLRQSIESFTISKSIDDGRVSPLDAPPRFAQRWSHRASQISQEYMTDCEVPVSPFDDRQNALAFAQRLSTVFDGEDAEDTATETPEAALSRLEGNGFDCEERSEARRSVSATAEGLNNAARPPLFTHSSAPRSMPSKADSGYVSDASHRSMQQEYSYNAGARYSGSPVRDQRPPSKSAETTPRAEPDDEEMEKHMLNMPPPSPGPTTPSRPDAAKKHSSFIKRPGLKRSTLAASKATLNAHDSVDSSIQASAEDVAGSSPADTKPIKSSKKLQKRMPEELRQQRRALREAAKQKQLSIALAGQDDNGTELLTDIVSSPLPLSEPPTPSTSRAPASPLAVHNESMPAELVGDSPAELDTDESAMAPRRSTSGRQSRKSRRRSRQNTVTATTTTTATDTEDGADQKPRKRSFSLGRKRSKSKRRSGSLTPKNKREEVPAVPSIAALSAMWSENGSQESLPLYSDHSSVARTLGTSPYDISTSMFKTSRSSRPVLDDIQSPHQISTAFSRTKTGCLAGMDSAMASELARRKSRDVAIQNNEELYDPPRSATPKKHSQQDVTRVRSSMPNAIVVEQRSPGWAAKPNFAKPSFESLNHPARERPHSIAESIPSLPELPADAGARAVKAAEYLAKRSRMQAFPILAESPSPAASPNPSNTEDPGFSNESIADAVAKAVAVRRAKRAERTKQEGQDSCRLRPMGPRMNNNASSSTGKVSLRSHTPDERPYSDASASIMIGYGSERGDQEGRRGTAPAHHGEEEPLVWERQAQLWRQKRESAGTSLNKPVGGDADTDATQAASSTSIVASPQGRSSARDDLQSSRLRRKSASEHARDYLSLIGSEDHTPPGSNRASTQSTSIVTGDSPTRNMVNEETPSAKTYQTSSIYRSRSPGGRVRTPSGSYHPYTPDYAAQAERSRLGSLAQLEGRGVRGTQSMDIQRRVHHEQTDTLDSIVGRYDRTLSPVPASEAGSVDESPARRAKGPERGPLIDRYGGGLQYGYERGVGLQGSSGMRNSMTAKAPRGGNQFSEQFGLDLGDVPMFLSRAR